VAKCPACSGAGARRRPAREEARQRGKQHCRGREGERKMPMSARTGYHWDCSDWRAPIRRDLWARAGLHAHRSINSFQLLSRRPSDPAHLTQSRLQGLQQPVREVPGLMATGANCVRSSHPFFPANPLLSQLLFRTLPASGGGEPPGSSHQKRSEEEGVARDYWEAGPSSSQCFLHRAIHHHHSHAAPRAARDRHWLGAMANMRAPTRRRSPL